MKTEPNTKLVVCSTALAVALWGMSPAISAELKTEKDPQGKTRIMHVASKDDRSAEILRLADGSAIDTEWAHFRGAVDIEWA